jgi:hypothetical protein
MVNMPDDLPSLPGTNPAPQPPVNAGAAGGRPPGPPSVPALPQAHQFNKSATTAPQAVLPAQPAAPGLPGWAIALIALGGCFLMIPVVAIMAAMLLPALAAAKRKAEFITSSNNLKEIGIAFRIWEGNHNDQYPFNVSQAQGGVKELCRTDANGFEENPAAVFMVMSNELSTFTPRILVCPNDPTKQMATNFAHLTAGNISYGLRTGPDVNDSHPDAVLVVDPFNGLVLHCDGTVQKDIIDIHTQ